MNKKIMSKNKWMKAAGVMMALMLAVLAVPGTAEAAVNSGILDGVTYEVGATANRNYGTGYGRYVDVRKSMALTVTFHYKDPSTSRMTSTSARSSGTTYVSATTSKIDRIDICCNKTVSELYLGGRTFTATGNY